MNKNDIIEAILDGAKFKPDMLNTLFGFAIVEACKRIEEQPINLEELELKTVHLLEAIRMAKSANSSYTENELLNNVKHFLNQL